MLERGPPVRFGLGSPVAGFQAVVGIFIRIGGGFFCFLFFRNREGI